MPSNDSQLLDSLREAILRDDRRVLEEVRRVLGSPEELDSRTGPLVEQRISGRVAHLKENFDQEFGPQTEAIIERKLESSKEELLNIIYPVLGKMIKKFISMQFQLLQESIEQRIKSTQNSLSPRNIWRKIKGKIFGISESERLLQELSKTSVEEVYMVQKGSGLLLGSFSRTKTLDQDVIAGMLTAIKGFVEDAFQKERQELEMIEWQNYQILIQNYHTYYVAVAVSGTVTTAYREDIATKLNDFLERELKHLHIREVNNVLYEKLSEKIAVTFR